MCRLAETETEGWPFEVGQRELPASQLSACQLSTTCSAFQQSQSEQEEVENL
jgi:hypothetical protein